MGAAHWSYLQSSARQFAIGKIVDNAMVGIESDNQRLKGLLPKNYAHLALDKHFLIDPGDKENRAKDILDRVYEYFLAQVASAEGKNGGQFYTPYCIVRLLVEILATRDASTTPHAAPAACSCSRKNSSNLTAASLETNSNYGQESNATTHRLAIMNLALRGIKADFGPEHAETYRNDTLRDKKILSQAKIGRYA